LEVHYRHNQTSPQNADYATALSPADLHKYVEGVRFAEIVLGSNIKTPHPAEAAMQAYRVQL
jgi:sialic acid synthase SpsE